MHRQGDAVAVQHAGQVTGAAPSLLVALTTTIDVHAGSHARPAVFLYTSYIQALAQIGLAPVLITPAHSAAAIDALIDKCCGMVLSGGEDVDPSRYGEEPSPALGTVEPARDESEFRAVACATARGMPIFGICRGLQVLNVHFGGTLYQDIMTDREGEHVVHEQTGGWSDRAHGANVAPDSLLRSIVGEERLHINSFHHQAVKHLGSDLRVVARADDGLVEAIEHKSYPWLLGVQWHPERKEAHTPESDPDRRLFEGFREAVSDYATRARQRSPSAGVASGGRASGGRASGGV
jgi:putative glutamine amidotransferase